MKFYSLDSHPNYVDVSKSKPVLLPAESQVIYPVLAQNVQNQIGVTVVDLARHSLKEVKLKEYVDNAINTIY